MCFYQTFTLTFISLHLPVGSPAIYFISIEMFRCQPFFFPEIWILVSPSSGLSDSTFLISSSSALFFSEGCCSLPISLTLTVQVPGFPFTRVPQILLDKEIEDWKSALDLELFLVFQTIGIETCQLIILSLLVGQWATTLVLYLPPVVLPSSEFCSWTGYTSVWQCLWA